MNQYLKYVFEIAAIAIGITLSFVVDEWREERQKKEKVVSSLMLLIEDLREDSLKINYEIDDNSAMILKIKNTTRRINSQEATIDTIIHIMSKEFEPYWNYHYLYNSTTYQEMVGNNILQLLPDSLSKRIVKYYNSVEHNYNLVTELMNQYRESLNEYSRTYPPFIDWNKNPSLYKTVWGNINPSHLWSRALWLSGGQNLLWREYYSMLNEEKEELNLLLENVKSYISESKAN